MHLVEARDLTLCQAQPDEDERIEVGLYAIKELARMARANKIRDAKTLVGILWLLDAQK
jgi:hypothetical protein